MNDRTRILLIGSVSAAAAIAVALLPRVAQPLEYHNFADQRTFLSVPNFLNVISNAPFLLAGIWGFTLALHPMQREGRPFLNSVERWPYLILSVGVSLTCFGSAYYHLAPNNSSLVWDRLPMTLGFMSLLSAMLMERINLRAGSLALAPLLLLGIASVAYWYVSELHGAGDLRLYLMVQFYTLALILLLLWLFPARYTRGGDVVMAMEFYVLAKILEMTDKQIFNFGHIISGHTLNDRAAALGVYWIFRMLNRRSAVLPG